MPLQPFATSADLAKLMSDVETATADLALELISGAIRDSLGWDVDERAGRVYTTLVRFRAPLRSVVLPALNVTVLTSVVVDDVTLPVASYDGTESGVVYLNGVLAHKKAVVTYTAGYKRTPTDEAPPVLRAVCLDYAMKLAGNPGGVRSYSMGGVSETFASDARDLADADCRLDHYRVEP
jgi:hypothetical protein